MLESKQKYKIWLKILRNFIFVLIAFIVVIIIFIFCVVHKHKELIISNSPDSSYDVVVEYSSEDSWPFGPHTIYVYIKKDTDIFKSKVIKTKLYNDGKNPDENNCIIEWNGDVSKITLTGEEQSEKIIYIDCEKREIID